MFSKILKLAGIPKGGFIYWNNIPVLEVILGEADMVGCRAELYLVSCVSDSLDAAFSGAIKSTHRNCPISRL
jgi:hypothetical protein